MKYKTLRVEVEINPDPLSSSSLVSSRFKKFKDQIIQGPEFSCIMENKHDIEMNSLIMQMKEEAEQLKKRGKSK